MADMTERGGKVGGADEDAVDAIDRGDGFQIAERGAGLDLDQHAKLGVGGLR